MGIVPPLELVTRSHVFSLVADSPPQINSSLPLLSEHALESKHELAYRLIPATCSGPDKPYFCTAGCIRPVRVFYQCPSLQPRRIPRSNRLRNWVRPAE